MGGLGGAVGVYVTLMRSQTEVLQAGRHAVINLMAVVALVAALLTTALHLPSTRCPSSPLPATGYLRRHSSPLLGPRKKPEPVEAEPTVVEDSVFTNRRRLVDGMQTSLGRDEELMPAPGPEVIDEPEQDVDSRPLFANLALFVQGLMPSEDLQDAYYEWLTGSANVCLPHYLLSAQDFAEEMVTVGDVLTDDEIAQLDAQAC